MSTQMKVSDSASTLSSTNESQDSDSVLLLKNELKGLLYERNGCADDERVTDIITKLSELRPCPKDYANPDYFSGDFASLSIPNFPGRIKATKEDNEVVAQWTLGRLSFNIFQPNELVCSVRSIKNLVHPKSEEDDGTPIFTYYISMDITIHTPDGDLPATLITRAFCQENKGKDNRMSVTFTGGSLIPGNERIPFNTDMLDLWKKTFENAYEKARNERSFLGSVLDSSIGLFMGLTRPTDSAETAKSRDEHSFTFDMSRSPKGFLDVVYFDDSMRITKGNRGTITVVERLSTKSVG